MGHREITPVLSFVQVTCFHCRQQGHKLGECPNSGGGARGREAEEVCGMCFKCGSAEHTSKSCRVSLAPGWL